jgi:ubiquinone/menaquinone biosynthesis C-methylase UbiE
MANSFLEGIKKLILGRRPYNTIFSFNYHNIRPVVNFLTEFSNSGECNVEVLLDVGAGQSPYFELFQSKVKKYIATDLEGLMPENETRSIEQKVGAAENLPIENNCIDVVMSNQVLEHVLDERKSVAEAFRVLKNGGYFIGSVPHISPIHLEPYDFRRFTEYGLKQLLENQGFKVLKIEGNGGVRKAVALTLTMDWFLSKHEEGKPQKFKGIKQLLLFPLVGFINIKASLLDAIFGDKKRSPSNYCWIAKKVNA